MFDKFDPLAAKQATDTEVAMNAVKREIRNILESYFGWYDPFCELIQNSLDSLEEQISNEDEDYEPQLRIRINLKEQTVSVADNGTGLDTEKYEKFLATSYSFKKGNTRGKKGDGATY
ncbi:MAG: ATP-binding protein, partial [candidate division Zixibacteria bacterium]|nr:ATP-binding protein [candidate division Zixibacteria bacterium]